MSQKALEVSTPKTTPLKQSGKGIRTPKSSTKSQKTPKSGKKSTDCTENKDTVISTPRTKRQVRKLEITTPYRLKKRNAAVATEEQSSSDSDVSSDDEINSETSSRAEDGSTDIPAAPPTEGGSTAQSSSVKSITNGVATGKSVSSNGARSSKSRRSRAEPTIHHQAEDYFVEHGQQPVTSDHTLSRLDTPRLDQEAVAAMLHDIPTAYSHERQSLYEEHIELFHRWMFQLHNGFNLLLHGLGSKRQLLETFCKSMLSEFTHVVVNGYFPSITVKNILNTITDEVLDHKGNFRSPMDQLDFIKENMETQADEDVFLILHNIDGPMLRSEKAQSVLSLLAQVRGLYIIASIDHINAPLMWDQTKVSRFNWLWYDTTTYLPYVEETSYENSLLVQQSGALALSSLTNVMQSLTPNAKKIFMIVVQYQLDSQDNPAYIGISFQDLYQKCREAFLVNSDLTLKAQLTEFRDHKLIKSRKGIDGIEHLFIPLDAATLTDFTEQLEES
ncbi:origin recognition complex subunit 2 [Lingula anatina]|uniref:Origin recognition complex subunit 2 n=1 Tax=Lingula anatina TaxID=7574 RepID=A0A1S3I135_LINAN|nr:origin recognition complex subunit 2 [Lingula anatina]|eukprot:XP_013391973.1 origin recognition complex subunit 2 [Lingula anatina]